MLLGVAIMCVGMPQHFVHHLHPIFTAMQPSNATLQVHEELQGYDELIAKFCEAPATDWESIVSSCRSDMGVEFFTHLNSRVQALHVRLRVHSLRRLGLHFVMLASRGISCVNLVPLCALLRISNDCSGHLMRICVLSLPSYPCNGQLHVGLREQKAMYIIGMQLASVAEARD